MDNEDEKELPRGNLDIQLFRGGNDLVVKLFYDGELIAEDKEDIRSFR